jgi:hypothetical protein
MIPDYRCHTPSASDGPHQPIVSISGNGEALLSPSGDMGAGRRQPFSTMLANQHEVESALARGSL